MNGSFGCTTSLSNSVLAAYTVPISSSRCCGFELATTNAWPSILGPPRVPHTVFVSVRSCLDFARRRVEQWCHCISRWGDIYHT